jgi:tetratricopeptide (TPR) repeat protein
MLALMHMILIVASTLVLLAATPEGAPRPVRAPVAPGAKAEALRHYAQGRLLEERGEGEAAINEYYRALVNDPGSATIARRISEAAARFGDSDRSLEFARRALAAAPGDARSLWLEGVALFEKNQRESALAALEAAFRADSENAEYAQALAHVSEEMGRADVQERAVRRLVDLRDDDAEAWFQLAALSARRDRFVEAEQALDRTAAINPDRPGLDFLRGWVAEGLGRDSIAVDAYRRHLRGNSGDRSTRQRLVSLLARRGEYAEAFREAQSVTRASNGDLDARFVEADLAFRSGHDREGRDLLAGLERDAAEDLAALSRLLGLEMLAGRATVALDLADRWAARHPGDARGAMLRARAAAITGRHAEAIERAREAVRMAPDSLQSYELAGRVFQGEKRWSGAESLWVEAARRFPDAEAVPLQLAFCREQMGDLAGAQRVLRELLARSPGNAEALNSLGYMLADHGQELPEAERLIRRALELEPANGAYIDSFGWVLYRLGRLEEARRELERALALTSGDPVVCEHLGDVYNDLKLKSLARQLYEKSLRGDAGNTRVRDKLQQGR